MKTQNIKNLSGIEVVELEMEEIEIKDLNAYQQQSEEPRAQKYAALHHNLLDSQMVA
ncbi:MAG: hypothetical protein HOE12_07060 [Gammaproteobacteria bacterium]|jgi:hypothetical protein|nr:hypothetical protein [Gammaproteobacteria bacterium]